MKSAPLALLLPNCAFQPSSDPRMSGVGTEGRACFRFDGVGDVTVITKRWVSGARTCANCRKGDTASPQGAVHCTLKKIALAMPHGVQSFG